MHDADTNKVTGLPGPLPPGERVMWQGRPDWKLLALRALHLRGLLIYFASIIAWTEVTSLWFGASPAQVALSTLRLGGVALVPIVLLGAYAWLTARVTIYTITNRRIGIQLGLALPMTLNIPLKTVTSAALNLRSDETGDIALSVSDGHKLNYAILWPFSRPLRIARPQPLLRALTDAQQVANILAGALCASLPVAVRVPVRAPVRVDAPPSRATLAA